MVSPEICNGNVSCGGAHDHSILSFENDVGAWRCLGNFDAAGASPVLYETPGSASQQLMMRARGTGGQVLPYTMRNIFLMHLDYYASTQHVNKTESAVRLTSQPSQCKINAE